MYLYIYIEYKANQLVYIYNMSRFVGGGCHGGLLLLLRGEVVSACVYIIEVMYDWPFRLHAVYADGEVS